MLMLLSICYCDSSLICIIFKIVSFITCSAVAITTTKSTSEGESKQRNENHIFVVNIDEGLDCQGLFDRMYAGLKEKLLRNSSLNVTTIESLSAFLSTKFDGTTKNQVLLFTNELITKKKNVQEIAKTFVADGGLAIFGCLFSSFARPPDMDAMFKNFGLSWKNSSYNRTTFGITEIGRSLLADIEERFSSKALQLSNVLPEQRLYTPVPNTTTQSIVFAPEPVDQNSVLSAFGKIGNGAVSYIGDVNAEEGTKRLTVALCLSKCNEQLVFLVSVNGNVRLEIRTIQLEKTLVYEKKILKYCSCSSCYYYYVSNMT